MGINRVNISLDNPSIVFDRSKCDDCGICKNICKFNVGVYGYSDLKHPCIKCGSCTIMCPNKCLSERDETDILREYLHSGKTIAIQIAPAVRVAIGEEFGYKPGINTIGKLITALRLIGADYVFDTTFGADLTTMEEAYELVNRIKNKGKLPMFTSCCPSWTLFTEMFYPEYLDNLSTCRSPIFMEGSIIKNYFSDIKKINKDDIINIAIVPCTSKKMERLLFDDIDLVITTREIAKYLKEENVKFSSLKNGNFNSIMNKGSGSGIIFGSSGGVLEATMREVYRILAGRRPSRRLLNFKEIRGLSNIKEANIKIKGINIKVAAINGTEDARRVIEKLKNNEVYYDFIEVMACEGGCIAGGGQPRVYPSTRDLKVARMRGLYDSDRKMKIRCASLNNDIINVYNNFLGDRGGSICEKYLHRGYNNNYKNK